MLTLRLQLRGHDVVHAVDGEAAIIAVEAEAPDLVLLDMNLPKLDGWTVARRVREFGGTGAATPIIGVSAHAMAGDRQKALEAGCDEYETKPVEWANLSPKIDQLLARSG